MRTACPSPCRLPSDAPRRPFSDDLRRITEPEAYRENVSQDASGELDFFDESHTQNGRATFSFSAIESAPAGDPQEADFMLVLNRNEHITPAVARLDARQAAAYFMLGETDGTSAGGAEEAGRNLGVPGANPFWPGDTTSRATASSSSWASMSSTCTR